MAAAGEASASELNGDGSDGSSERSLAQEATWSSDGDNGVLLGARHNVSLRSTESAVACRCVSVLLGPASMPQLAWKGEPPRIKPETQLVIALAPTSDCPSPPAGADGASYWGYRIQGNDVVVLLEPLVPGPPRTIAAVIPKPPAEGQVYVAPVTSGFPYGLPLDGNGTRCALGNPGPKRIVALTEAELGSRPASSQPAGATYSD